MDCFYVAVERMHDPSLYGKSCAVMQYNPYEKGGVKSVSKDENRRRPDSNGSIIAVSYEARARGVTRQMRGAEAKRKCPDIILVQVPTAFGKADLRIYKAVGAQIQT
jgi:DNA polymerase eta